MRSFLFCIAWKRPRHCVSSPVWPPLNVLQVPVCVSEEGYTIIQLSFRTGLKRLKRLALKKSIAVKHRGARIAAVSSPLVWWHFPKTHLAWIWSSYILTEAALQRREQTGDSVCYSDVFGVKWSVHCQRLAALLRPQARSWVWAVKTKVLTGPNRTKGEGGNK